MSVISSLFNREPVASAILAAREHKLVSAAAALRGVSDRAAAAHHAVAVDQAHLAAAERELDAVPPPGIVDAENDRLHDQRRRIGDRVAGYRRRLDASAAQASACNGELAAARDAVRAAQAELDAPAPIDEAALARLEAEVEKAQKRVDEAAANRAKIERAVEPQLAEYNRLAEAGATEEDARKIVVSRRAALEKLAAAAADLQAREEAAAMARARFDAIEAARDAQRKAEDQARLRERLTSGLVKMNSHAEGLKGVVEAYDRAGESMGSLIRTAYVWLHSVKRRIEIDSNAEAQLPAALMAAPHFVQSAGMIESTSNGMFVGGINIQYEYGNFEVRDDILRPLLNLVSARGSDTRAALNASLPIFHQEYGKLANVVIECMAAVYLWRRERDALFAEVGEIANGVRRPECAPISPMGGELAIWRRVCLPSLARDCEAYWRPEWSPERLLELTKRSAAA